jgi:hypothetical protein
MNKTLIKIIASYTRQDIKVIQFIKNNNVLSVFFTRNPDNYLCNYKFTIGTFNLNDLKDLYGIFIYNKVILNLIKGNDVQFELALSLYSGISKKIRSKKLKKYISIVEV